MENDNPLNVQVGGDHYKNCQMQPLELSEGVRMNNCMFSILRYTFRHKNKKGIEDLKKALHYIELQDVASNPWYIDKNKDYLFRRFLTLNCDILDANQKIVILAIQTHNKFMLEDAIKNEIKECYGKD